MSTKLLAPLDGSELADSALPYVERVAQTLNLPVVLLCVIEHEPERRPPTEPLVEGSVAHYRTEPHAERVESQHLKAEEAAAYDRLGAVAERLVAAGLSVEREVAPGRPRDIIAGRANSSDIELVVMASHGRTGLQRLLRGSVADGVVHDVRRPVLVVRPFRDEQARVDLEHAELLPGDRAATLQEAVHALHQS